MLSLASPKIAPFAPVAVLWLIWAFTLLHQSDDADLFLDRYSARYFAATILYLMVTIVASVLAVGFPQKMLAAFDWIAARMKPYWMVVIMLGGAAWWALPVETRLKIYPTVLLFILLGALLPRTSLASWGERWFVPVFIGLTVAALLIQLVVLPSLPYIHTHDEGAYSHIAMSYLQTGRLGGDLYGYPPRAFMGFGSWLVTLGWWYQTLGFGWWTGRIYSYILSVLALVVIWFTARRLGGIKAAAAAVCFMALNTLFIETHRIRPDAITILLISASLGLFLAARQHPRLYVVTGFVAALTLEAHLMGLAFWGAYAVYLLLEWLNDYRQSRRFTWPRALIWFTLGSIIPAVVFFVTHILPDLGKPSAIPLSPQPGLLDNFAKEFVRWQEFLNAMPLETLFVIWAIGFLWMRRSAIDKMLLGLFGLMLLAYVFISPNHWATYTRYFLPIMILLIAAMWSGRLHPVHALVAASLFFGLLAGEAYRALPDEDLRTPAVVEYIEEHIPPGETVIINMYYYMFFEDSYRYVVRNPSLHPPTIKALGGPPEAEFYSQLNPGVVVVDLEKDEHNPWMDAQIADYDRIDQFADEGIEIFVRPDLNQEHST